MRREGGLMTLASGGWTVAVCDFAIDWSSYFTGAAQRLPTNPSATVSSRGPYLQETNEHAQITCVTARCSVAAGRL